MALGGGKWTAQNKVLPGTYVNFVSAASASDSISDRGVVTMPLSLDWDRRTEFLKSQMKILRKGHCRFLAVRMGHRR